MKDFKTERNRALHIMMQDYQGTSSTSSHNTIYYTLFPSC